MPLFKKFNIFYCDLFFRLHFFNVTVKKYPTISFFIRIGMVYARYHKNNQLAHVLINCFNQTFILCI